MSLWTCHGGPNQKFTYSTDGEIKGINGLCVDAAQVSSQNGTKVLVWTCHGGMNQKWQP